MWFKVTKAFSTAKVGELMELKEDSQYQLLIDKGLIEVSEAPKAEPKVEATEFDSTPTIIEATNEVPVVVENAVNETGTDLETQTVSEAPKAKPGRKTKK